MSTQNNPRAGWKRDLHSVGRNMYQAFLEVFDGRGINVHTKKLLSFRRKGLFIKYLRYK